MIAGISQFLLMEQEFEVDMGHAEMIAVIERHIRELEGDWVLGPAPLAARDG